MSSASTVIIWKQLLWSRSALESIGSGYVKSNVIVYNFRLPSIIYKSFLNPVTSLVDQNCLFSPKFVLRFFLFYYELISSLNYSENYALLIFRYLKYLCNLIQYLMRQNRVNIFAEAFQNHNFLHFQVEQRVSVKLIENQAVSG